ncbi:meiotic nuclear division protein 1 homolog isoform X5 [Moschus berezovskii]|uniref:meiotic nuclear division protein 1 homolog isoform X5 n=1 Tax=Moschus berezovskii TaxID=68408 RepID=UPI002443B93B|nr:meiotic nuclear division protein 1 homolog isoform X5 [Moschus berezovskii]
MDRGAWRAAVHGVTESDTAEHPPETPQTWSDLVFLCGPSKKKGLSAEEKRTRMMEIFYETKDVFQLKDMEKIAPKEKGITAMSVKEVLQSLVDDGMVDCERIGTSNYYWAFPSKALHARKRKLEVLDSQLSEGNQKYANLQKSIEKAKIGRRETVKQIKWPKQLLTDGLIWISVLY